MYPTVTLGPLVLPTSGLVYIIGAWVVLSVIERAAKSLDLDADSTYGVGVVALLCGFIGARLVFVILHWTAYRDDLLGIFWPLNSGFDAGGGVIVGLFAAVLYGRSKKLPLESTLDALAPGIISMLLLVSLADFLGGPGYGLASDLPWSINVFGIRRHPVQVYEMIVAIGALLAWTITYRKRRFEGQLFLISLSIYCGGRLLVDAFRANAWLTPGGYHIIQIICLAILLACIYFLGRGAQKNNLANEA